MAGMGSLGDAGNEGDSGYLDIITCRKAQDHFRYLTASVVTTDPRATGVRFVFW
jgi:hypothetical protein